MAARATALRLLKSPGVPPDAVALIAVAHGRSTVRAMVRVSPDEAIDVAFAAQARGFELLIDEFDTSGTPGHPRSFDYASHRVVLARPDLIAVLTPFAETHPSRAILASLDELPGHAVVLLSPTGLHHGTFTPESFAAIASGAPFPDPPSRRSRPRPTLFPPTPPSAA